MLCRRCDGRIKESKRDVGGFDVYHAYGSSVAAYQGDNAQRAFDRVVFSIDLNQIDWQQPLRKYIEDELRELKNEKQNEEEYLGLA